MQKMVKRGRRVTSKNKTMMQQQQTDYIPLTQTHEPLTQEQEEVLEKAKKETGNIAFLLPIAQILMTSSLVLTRLSLKSHPHVIFLYSMQIPIHIIGFFMSRYFMLKRQRENTILFTNCNHYLITGLFTQSVFLGSKKDRPEFIRKIIPLLYKITKWEADQAFTTQQSHMLRKIASKSYWHKNEPDLVAAALVGLLALHDDKSKGILTKLAAKSAKSGDTSEKWVSEAAKICLDQWEVRWVQPSYPNLTEQFLMQNTQTQNMKNEVP
jgi:hypothetical protein